MSLRGPNRRQIRPSEGLICRRLTPLPQSRQAAGRSALEGWRSDPTPDQCIGVSGKDQLTCVPTKLSNIGMTSKLTRMAEGMRG